MKKKLLRERDEVTEPEIIDNLDTAEEPEVIIEESPKKKKTTKKKGSK